MFSQHYNIITSKLLQMFILHTIYPKVIPVVYPLDQRVKKAKTVIASHRRWRGNPFILLPFQQESTDSHAKTTVWFLLGMTRRGFFDSLIQRLYLWYNLWTGVREQGSGCRGLLSFRVSRPQGRRREIPCLRTKTYALSQRRHMLFAAQHYWVVVKYEKCVFPL